MSERLDTLNRNCPAMRYLRNVIRAAIKASESNAEQIMVNDGCDKHFYAMNENGVSEAARWALEIDGPITIRIHRITLQVMYDGPYDKDNRAEIIMDSNERASQLIDTLDDDGRMTKDVAVIAASTLSKSALLEAAQNAIELGDDA